MITTQATTYGKAATPASIGATITNNEIRRDARRPYRAVRIQAGVDEWELNFDPRSTDIEILSEPLRYWRVI